MFIPGGFARRILAVDGSQKVAGDQLGSLMNKLVKSVLPVRSRLPPDDSSGGVIHPIALVRDTLAIAFHISLLEIRGKVNQVQIGRASCRERV